MNTIRWTCPCCGNARYGIEGNLVCCYSCGHRQHFMSIDKAENERTVGTVAVSADAKSQEVAE